MSPKSDMYSLGVIIVELVTGHKGTPNKDNVRVFYLVTEKHFFKNHVSVACCGSY